MKKILITKLNALNEVYHYTRLEMIKKGASKALLERLAQIRRQHEETLSEQYKDHLDILNNGGYVIITNAKKF